MENQKPVQVDRFKFAGQILLQDRTLIQPVHDAISEDYKIDVPEIEKTPETIEQLDSLIKATAFFITTELNIDVSSRLPSINNFHQLSLKDYSQKVSESPHSVAASTISGDIYFTEARNVSFVLETIGHELIHVVCANTIRLDEKPSGLVIRNPYRGYEHNRTMSETNPNRVYASLNEALTDLTAIEIKATQWKNYPALRELDPTIYAGYIPEILIVDELIKQLSTENGSYKDDLRAFQTGAIRGDFSALRKLTDKLGPQGLKLLAYLDARDPVATLKTAVKLGLGQVVDKVYDAIDGKHIHILEAINPAITITRHGLDEVI